MIDNKFIEGARQIKNQYSRIHEELEAGKKELGDLSSYLIEKAKELEIFNEDVIKKAKSKEEIAEISNKLLGQLTEIEEREKSMTKQVNSSNEKLDKLKAEEFDLLQQIKRKYPLLSNDQIRKEIHSRL